jgi:hypothetical protein
MYCCDGVNPVLERCHFSVNAVTGTIWPEGGGGLYNYAGCNPLLTKCRFTGNSARYGSGMANLFDSDPVCDACIFEGNTGIDTSEGGGVYNYSFCDPALSRCVWRGNTADYGAGMASFFDCLPTLTACTLQGNSADVDGGGLYNYSNCHAGMINCLFSGNSAASGGAVINLFASDALLANNTLAGNSASSAGGGVYNYESAPELTNTILWDNSVGAAMDEAAQIFNFNSTPTIDSCSIEGWTGGLGGANNDGLDPTFRDADGADDIFGTADDDARLLAGSASEHTGDNGLIPPGITTDLDGRPRIHAGTVDRGAYERIPASPGDFDGNGSVGAEDLGPFVDCMAGPGQTPAPCETSSPACLEVFDMNVDDAVDLLDFALMQDLVGP